MDSLTQAALGGAVGELLLGRKLGYRAAVWGAALGTLPDLDILVNPFVDTVNEIYFHRGITHSIFFAIAISPLLGWLIDRFHKQLEVGWFRWANLSFWVILTHILIDMLTNYGTQMFLPFSNHPVALDSVFIIDPLYTLPLLAGLIASLFMARDSDWRLRVNQAGLIISTFYLLWGLAIKTHVITVFEQAFENSHGSYEEMKTMPNGPTSFLWTGYIIRQDTIYQSVYSIFDESHELKFQALPRGTSHIEPYMKDRAIENLMWFSRGYYMVVKEDKQDIAIYDLRFGRDDFWLSEDGNFVWRNELVFDDSGHAYTYEIEFPPFNLRADNLKLFRDRLWGE